MTNKHEKICSKSLVTKKCKLKSQCNTATATAKSLELCSTLCDPIPGILQARTLEWVAISFSNA